MGKKSKKSRTVGRRALDPVARTAPKSKVINPIVIGAVAVTMILVMIFTVAPQAAPSQGGDRPAGPTGKIDSTTQQRVNNLEETLRTDAKNIGVLIELGNTYFDTGQYNKAVDRYSQALEIDPNNTNVRTDLGFSYFNLGMYNQAIKEYRKALEVDPKKPETHLNLGVALVSDVIPNVDEAISEWQKAIEFAGGNKDLAKKAQDQINKYKR